MYNKQFFESLSKVIVVKGSKRPKEGFKHSKNTNNNITIESILKQGYNVGIRTGKTNNLTVVDLDTHHKEVFYFPFDIEELCKTTYWQKSASGGIHLFYQYDKDIKQGQNDKIYVDTRNAENGYIMFDGSTFKGKKYQGQNDLIPSKIPEDVKQFLLNNGYDNTKFEKNEKKNNDSNITIKDTQITKDKNLFIPKSHLKQILDEKPNDYINGYDGFFKFTSCMKYLDAYDLWDEFSKKRDGYDFNKNRIIWNNVKADRCNINFLIDLFNNKNFSSYYNLKHLPQFSLDSVKINKQKLGYDFIQENKNYIIKSDTGTGKTTSVKHFLYKTKDNFISIVSRKSLGQEQYNNFNTDNFLECDYYEYVDKINNKDNIIIQLDSILKIHRNIDLSQYIIILDEFESIIHYLFTSSTLKTKRVLIFIRFIEILKQCKNFICIDADITHKSIEFLHTFIKRNEKKRNEKADLSFEKLEIQKKEDSIKEYKESLEMCLEEINTLQYEIKEDEYISIKDLIIKGEISLRKLKREFKEKYPDEFEYIPRKYELIENSYKHNKDVNAYEIQTEDLFIEKLKKEDKFLCCCDSKNTAEELKQKINDETINIIHKEIIKEFENMEENEYEKDILDNTSKNFIISKIMDYLKSFEKFEELENETEERITSKLLEIIKLKVDDEKYNYLLELMDDGCNFIDCIKDIITINLEDKHVVCITSDTDEYYNFDEHNKIIYSPKVIYGIDSSMKRPVYCFYKEHTINTKQMVQQIARCRNITNLYYHFVKKEYKPNPISFNEVYEINKKIVDYGMNNPNNLIETNFRMIDESIEKDYINLFSKFEYEDICYNTNKFCHFLKLLDERGFILKTYRMMKIKKIDDDILPLEDENNDEEDIEKINKYTKQFFSKTKNKKILEIIGLDLDKHFDTIRDNMSIITRYNFIQEYYNIKYYFYDYINDSKLLEKINSQNEFILGKVSNNSQKIRLLLKLKEMTGCKDKNKLESTVLLNEEQINKFIYEYKMIFEKKYYDEKFKFDTLYNQDKILNKLYKRIFTKYITRSVNERVNGKQRYMYYLNEIEYNKFKSLIDLRNENIKKQEYYDKIVNNINKSMWPDILKNNFNLF